MSPSTLPTRSSLRILRRCAAVASAAAVTLLAVPPPAHGEACKLDTPPAATLLLPYFEVDLKRPDGITTLFSVGNAADHATLTHVTVWTDLGVPTMDFNVYLTGWDIETFNLRDLFRGRLPQTASDGQDPNDTISPQGPFSQDIHIASCAGVLPLPAQLPDSFLVHMVNSHTGKASPIFGGSCSGRAFADDIARGYVTIDVVRECSFEFPGELGYFGPGGVALSDNVLFGDYMFVESAQNAARGDQLVRIEAFPGRFRPGDTTFYGRFTHGGASTYQAVDDREPLAANWAARYIKGSTVFTAGTSITVWRDPGRESKAVPCGQPQSWQTLESMVVFDENEDVVVPDFCPFTCPPTASLDAFTAVAQRVEVDDLQVPSWPGGLAIPFDFGWLQVAFNRASDGAPAAQAWMGTEMTASGRFSVGMTGMAVGSSCGPQAPLPGF
jgi:hypothetical protein